MVTIWHRGTAYPWRYLYRHICGGEQDCPWFHLNFPMGDTLALALVLMGLVLLFGFSFTSLKLVLVIVFLWLASPVSSHLIAQMMYERKKREDDNI